MADTQGDLITIDNSAFKKFRSEIDAINDGLDKMGDGLGTVEKVTKGLNLRVRGLPEFKEFLQTISSFRGLRNADKFKSLLVAAKDAADASRLLLGIDSGALKKVEAFVETVEKLRTITSFASVAGSLDFKKFNENLKGLIDGFGSALKGIGKTTDIKNLEPLKKAALGIKEVLNIVATLNNSKAVAINSPALITMRNLVDQLNSIAAKTNGAKTEQFRALVDSITALGALLGKGGSGNVLLDLAKQVGNFLKFTVAIPIIILVIKGVFTIMNIITLLPGTISGVLLQKFDKTITSFAESMRVLGKALSPGRGEGFSGGVGDLLRSVGTIVKLGVVLPTLFAVIISLFKLTGAVSSVIPGGEQMFALADAFRRIASAFFNFSESLKEGGVERLKKVSGLFALMATAFKGIATVLSLVPGTSELERLSVAFRNMGLALIDFNDALGGSKNQRTLTGGGLGGVVGRILKLGIALPALFGLMTALFKSFSAVLRVIPGQDSFERFALGFKALGQGINAISQIGTSFQNIGVAIKGIRVVGQLTDGIKKIAANLVSAGLFEQVTKFMISFGELGTGLKKAVEAGKDIKLPDLILLPIKFRIIGQAIGAMAAAVVGKDPQGVQVFALAIRNLGQGLKNIREALSQNTATDKKAILGVVDILKLIITLRLVLNTVASVAKSATPEGIKAAAALMRDAGGLFKNLFEIFSSTVVKKVDAKNVLSIRDKMNLIKDIFKQLKGFAGKDLPDFGATFTALPKFLQSISTLDIKDEKGSATIKQKVQVISDALRQLSKIKLDNKGVQGLTKVAAALQAFANLKNPGKVESLVKSVVSAMQQIRGFTVNAKDIRQLSKFVDELVKSLQKFAAVKTTREQADALQALVKAIGEFKSGGSNGVGTALQDGLTNSNPKQLGTVAGTDIAEGVAEGMLRFNLRVKIVGIFKNIALAIIDLFNPLTLLGRLRTGFDFLVQKFGVLFGLIKQFRDAVKQLGEEISTIGGNLVSSGQNLISGFGISNITDSPAFKAAADFEELSTKVQVFGNLSDAATEQIRSLAITLGKDFPLSAGDALAAATDLVKSGLGVDQIKAALPVIVQLTSLTDSKDINTTSKGLIQVASTFKNFTDQVPAGFDTLDTAANLLSQAADSSTASVESLLQGLGNVGPIASGFNLSLQDTVAVLGLFENAGIRGAEAGTNLKSLLTGFKSKTAADEFRRLGVTITDNNGNFRDFNDILNDLNKSMNGTRTVTRLVGSATASQIDDVKKAEKAYAAASRQLFAYQNGLTTGSVNDDEETRAKKIAALQQVQANAQALIANITGSQAEAERVTVEITRTQAQNATSIQKLAGSFGSVGLSTLLAAGDDALKNFITTMGTLPSAGERAQQLLDNFNGDALQLQGSLETLGILGFEPLVKNIFRPMVQGLRAIIDALITLDPAILEVVTTGAAFAAILATVTGGLLVLVGAITQVGGSVLIFASSLLNQRAIFLGLIKGVAGFVLGLGTLVVTVLPLIALFGGLAFAMQQVRKIFEGDLGGANTAFSKLIESGKALFRTFQLITGTVFDFIRVLFGGSGGGKSPLEAAGGAIASVFDGLTTKLRAFSRTLQQTSTGFRTIIRALAKGVLTDRGAETLSKNPLFSFIFGIRGQESSAAGVQAIFGALQKRSAALKNILGATTATISNFFENLGKGASLKDAFNLFSGQLRFNLSQLGSEFLKLFGEVFNIDTSAITKILDGGDLLGGVQALIAGLGTKIKDIILNNKQGIGDVLETLFRTFFIPGRIFGTIAKLLGLDKIGKIFDEVANVLGGLFRGIVDTVFNLLSGQDLGTALKNAFQPLGAGIVTSLINVITLAIGGLGDLLGIDTTGFVDQIIKGFQPLLDDFSTGRFDDVFLDIGVAVVNLISAGIQTAVAGIGKILGIDTSVATNQIRLGFKPLENALEGDMGVGAIFGGVATAIATLLVTTLQLAIGKIGQLLHIDTQTIFDQLSVGFAPLAEAITSGGNAAEIFSGVVSAITGILATALVTGIESIGAILKVDTSKVVASVAASVQATAAAASEGDIIGTSTGLVGTVVNGLAGLLKIGIEKIGDVLHIDVTAMTNSLQTTIDSNVKTLQTGGPGAPFALVGTTIVGLIASAINGAVSGLGDLLNIDTDALQKTISDRFSGVLTTINNIFLGADGSSIFDSITTIINNVVTAFTALFNLFAPDKAGQVDNGAKSLGIIGDFLTTLANLTFSAIEIPLKAIDSIFTNLAAADPQSLAAALGALATVLAINAVGKATGITSLTGLISSLQGASIAGSVGSIKSLIQTAGKSTIAKGAAIFIIFEFISGLIANLKFLEKFDVAGVFNTIVKSFTDLGFNLLEILGIDTGTLRQQINTTIFQIGFLIRSVGILMGAAIQDNVITPLQNFLAEAFVNIRILGENVRLNVDAGAKTKFQATLDASNKFVEDAKNALLVDGRLVNAEGQNTNFGEFFNNVVLAGVGQFGDAIEGPIVKENLRVQALKALPGLISGFQQEFDSQLDDGKVTQQAKDTASKWVQAILFLDGFDDVARQAAASGDINLLGTLVEEAAKQGVPPEKINEALTGIYTAFQSGLATGQGQTAFTNSISVLDSLIANAGSLGLDPVKLEEFKKKITDEYNALVGNAQTAVDDAKKANETGDGGVQVEVPVDPKVVVTKPADEVKADADRAIKDSLTGGILTGAGGAQIPVDAGVGLNVTDTTVTNPDDVKTQGQGALTGDTGQVQLEAAATLNIDNISTPQEALDLQLALQALQVEFVNTDTTFAATVANLTLVWTPFSATVKADIEAINTKLGMTVVAIAKIPVALAIITPVTLVLLTNLGIGFTTMANTAITGFSRIMSKAADLNFLLQQILGNLAAVNSTPKPPGVPDNPLGGQSGITVHPNRIYEVTETGAPELLTMNGKTFLLPGSGGTGQVIPSINATSLTGSRTTVNTPSVNPNGQSGVGGSIIINEGDISVTIPVGGGDPAGIALAVKKAVIEARDDSRLTVADRLRNKGR